MRESERSNRKAAGDSERPGEYRSRYAITATPGSGAAYPPAGDDSPRAGEAPKPRAPQPKRLLALIGLAIAGLAALGGGVFGVVWAFSRTPTSAQVAAAADAESAQQWRWLTAGKIFPAAVSYQTSMPSVPTRATLIGIAPQASCAKAADPAAARALTSAGCVTVLRATYTDASRTVLDTVGVAVMKSTAAANDADAKLGSGTTSGLLPASFPATVSSAFTSRGRVLMDTQATGRYVVFDSAGYADGRKGVTDPGTRGGTGVTDLASALSSELMNRFIPSSNPCADREVRCSY